MLRGQGGCIFQSSMRALSEIARRKDVVCLVDVAIEGEYSVQPSIPVSGSTKIFSLLQSQDDFPQSSAAVSTDHDEIGFAVVGAVQPSFGYRSLQRAYVTICVFAG